MKSEKKDKSGYTIILIVGDKRYMKKHCSNDELYKLQQQGYCMKVLDEITGLVQAFNDQELWPVITL